MFCLKVWLSSTVFLLGVRQEGRCVCGSFSGHILLALCHSSCKLLKASEPPSFIVNALLNHLGKPILDFHVYIYKLWFNKNVVSYATELQSITKNTGKKIDHNPCGLRVTCSWAKVTKSRKTPREDNRVQWHKQKCNGQQTPGWIKASLPTRCVNLSAYDGPSEPQFPDR